MFPGWLLVQFSLESAFFFLKFQCNLHYLNSCQDFGRLSHCQSCSLCSVFSSVGFSWFTVLRFYRSLHYSRKPATFCDSLHFITQPQEKKLTTVNVCFGTSGAWPSDTMALRPVLRSKLWWEMLDKAKLLTLWWAREQDGGWGGGKEEEKEKQEEQEELCQGTVTVVLIFNLVEQRENKFLLRYPLRSCFVVLIAKSYIQF